jgi:hypothetical protein
MPDPTLNGVGMVYSVKIPAVVTLPILNTEESNRAPVNQRLPSGPGVMCGKLLAVGIRSR